MKCSCIQTRWTCSYRDDEFSCSARVITLEEGMKLRWCRLHAQHGKDKHKVTGA